MYFKPLDNLKRIKVPKTDSSSQLIELSGSRLIWVILTPSPFYKNILYFPGWSCSYKNGALFAKFQPDVLNPCVLICGCLLYWYHS